MSVSFEIKDKVAVITGGSGIIGSVIADELSDKGVKVAIVDLLEEKAKDIAKKINDGGGKAIGVGANVLNRDSLVKAKEEILKEFGTIDIIINGAGGNKKEASTDINYSFFDIDIECIKQVFDLNVTGAILTTQVFGEVLAEKKTGSVINISSMAAYHPLTKTIAYSGAKAAITNFTEWMAVHFNQNYSQNIRVNAIAPGFLLTTQNRYLMLDENGNDTDRGKAVLAKTPMGRYGEPKEMVGAIIWLCSEAASFVNGVVVPIDGGFSSYWGV